MINNVIILGRLTKDPELVETENGYKRTFIVIAVPRQYKNPDGEYESDFIKCVLWNATAEHTCEYCKKGDLVGIRGKIETSNYEKEGNKISETVVVAERVSFLSSKKEMDESQEEGS